MRNWLLLGGMAFLAACSSSKSGTSITCGDGTTLQGDMCVGTGGSGSDVTCGTGTHLEGSSCVPDAPQPTGAPTITSLTPNIGGISGGALFVVDGSGFAGDDVTDLHVYFGDTTPGTQDMPNPCEAQIGMATPTEITGQVPPSCDLTLNKVVTVTTNIGMATTNYQYVALFAADYDYDLGAPGYLWVIDPILGQVWGAGSPQDANMNTFHYQSMAFGPDGSLYAATPGDSAGDVDGVPELVKIDLNTLAVTPVGDFADAAGTNYYVTSIKSNGTALFGWGYSFVDGTQSLLSIDATSGAVTTVGTPTATTYTAAVGSIAFDGTGTLWAAPSGAGAEDDTTLTSTGELDTVDTTTGVLTTSATLDYPIGAPVNSIAFVGNTMIGVVDNGVWGAMSGEPVHGVVLAIIDPTQNPIVSPLYELPALTGEQSHITGLDLAPLNLTIARKIPHDAWKPLATASKISVSH